MTAASRSSNQASSWGRNLFGDRRRKRRVADKSRRARRRTFEPLEIRLVLNGLPPWTELPPDRLDVASQAPRSVADTGVLVEDLKAQIQNPKPQIQNPHSVVFVDSGLADYAMLAAAVGAQTVRDRACRR